MLLEGIFAAVTTCFYPDGRPYWRKLEANMDRYSLTPMSGMVLLGSTGEAGVLCDEEARGALRVVLKDTPPGKVLVAWGGVGENALKAGPSRTMLVPWSHTCLCGVRR